MKLTGIMRKCSCFLVRAFGYSVSGLRQTPRVENIHQKFRAFLCAYFSILLRFLEYFGLI